MIALPYSLVIEAAEDPDLFGFYSPDLEGFTDGGLIAGRGERAEAWTPNRPASPPQAHQLAAAGWQMQFDPLAAGA
jgi:hypothetical protein